MKACKSIYSNIKFSCTHNYILTNSAKIILGYKELQIFSSIQAILL